MLIAPFEPLFIRYLVEIRLVDRYCRRIGLLPFGAESTLKLNERQDSNDLYFGNEQRPDHCWMTMLHRGCVVMECEARAVRRSAEREDGRQGQTKKGA